MVRLGSEQGTNNQQLKSSIMKEKYDPALLKMDDESFVRLSTYVTREYGIKLPAAKRSMLESRLNKKVKGLGMNSYNEFLDFIFSNEGKQNELLQVVDLITTNKTDFFREPGHFQFLTNKFLPGYKEENRRGSLNIWSAACSTGEEPYTIIMALEEYKKGNPDTNYRLLASDVSTRVLQNAFQGIYDISKADVIPMALKKKYFIRSKTNPRLVRIKPEFRKKIDFKRINLMAENFELVNADYDVIFCRNVLIYFDKLTQERVINKFCRHLKPGGLLFLGHSESIIGMNLPLQQVAPTTFRYTG
jgi:chemotaxis protein methyltransferase CheR